MARKPTEYYQFKLRIRESLRRELEREAKRKERSANHEAVARIEETFDQADRMAAFRETMEKRIEEWKLLADQLRVDASHVRAELNAVAEKAKSDLTKQGAELQKLTQDLDRYAVATDMVDVLLGENEASRGLLRKIAHELISTPDWDGNKVARKAMADRVHAFIYPKEIFEGKRQ